MNEEHALALQPQTGHALAASPVVPQLKSISRDELSFLANMISGAGLIPEDEKIHPEIQKFRVMAKIVAGASYGFDPLSSQTCFHIINGVMTLSARGMSQLLYRTGEYTTTVEKLDDDGCKLAVYQNKSGNWEKIGFVEFTRKDADKAGLTQRKMYQKFAQDMFFARCMTRVIRRFAPHVLDVQAMSYSGLVKREAPLSVAKDEPVAALAGAEFVEDVDDGFVPVEAEAAAEPITEPEPTPEPEVEVMDATPVGAIDAEPEEVVAKKKQRDDVSVSPETKGRLLFEAGHVKRTAKGYEVDDPKEGEAFMVTKTGGKIVCTCYDFEQTDDPAFKCGHILAVKFWTEKAKVDAK